MRMQHVGGGVASHYMETDYLRLDCTASTYTVGQAIVNCTRDSVNVTTTYDGVTLSDNNNLILGVLLAFFGLLALGVGALTLR